MSQDTPNKPTRGGARKGAGRKAGSGQFKEPTVVKRIPESFKKIANFTSTRMDLQ